MSTKIYLSVPFERKEDAKSLGAKWDKDKKQWYTNAYNIQLIEKYPLSAPITELHGEKRDFEGSNLFVDLVPESCWFNNARTCIDSSDWDRLRNFIYARAGYMCECCQSKQNLEAHERWHFNEELRIQKLMRIIALCKQCHEVTHIGLAKVRGRFDIALHHLMKVTKMTLEQANCHIDKAFAVWELRNQHEWSLDLSILTNSGIKLSKLESKTKSSDFNNFYYQGDIIINLDKPDLSTPKQQIINHEPKIDNNKFKFLPSTPDKQVSKVGFMVNKIKILVKRIKMIIQPAKVNLSIKNSSKHYSNDWILQEFFLQLKQPSIFGTPISDPHFCPQIESISHAHALEKHLPLFYIWYVPNSDKTSFSVNGFVVKKILAKIIPEDHKNFKTIQKWLVTILSNWYRELLKELPKDTVPHDVFNHCTLHLEIPRSRSFISS